jgi:hypothetical protein
MQRPYIASRHKEEVARDVRCTVMQRSRSHCTQWYRTDAQVMVSACAF